jgi:class 3 adenylate cyclase
MTVPRVKGRLGALLAALLVAVICAGVATLAVSGLTFLHAVERYIDDWAIAELLPAEAQDEDIVIVAITDDTLGLFPYRSPIDRRFIADLLRNIAARGPRAIGVDILFDQPTEPETDAALRQAMAGLGVPLIVGYTEEPAVVNDEQAAFLQGFVPPRLRGLANLPTDALGVPRWIFPGARGKDGTYVMGFARALAAAAGAPSRDDLAEIAWHGRPGRDTPPFREYPAQLVAKLPAEWFAGKIVLVGADLSLTDRHRTPFSAVFAGNEGALPGIIIHAHALAQLLDHRRSPAATWPVNLAIALALALIGAALGTVELDVLPRAAIGAALLAVFWAAAAASFHWGGAMVAVVAPTLAFSGALWLSDAFHGREARRQREFIKSAFSRYLSPKIVEQLIRDPSKMSLEGERRVMTFMFTDLAGFTAMSEAIDSRELARTINAYFDGITRLILEHDGVVVKFIGDAVFAIFNAPLSQDDHAERGVRCALAIDRFAEPFRAELNDRGVPFGLTRIGLHTGVAVVGNFGASTRFDYTAQGDAVNTAARLEGLNKYLGTRICVSEETQARCPGLAFRPLAVVTVKGKSTALPVYEPLAADRADTPLMTRYRAAYDKLASGDPEAPTLWEALHAEAPDDPLIAMHLARLRAGERGVAMAMTEK